MAVGSRAAATLDSDLAHDRAARSRPLFPIPHPIPRNRQFEQSGVLGGGGSTTTERTGRRGYGVEIDPLYVDTTIARWEKMTGRQARHASGKTFAEFKADRAEGGVEASASEDVRGSEE